MTTDKNSRTWLPVAGIVVVAIAAVLGASLVDTSTRPERFNGDSVGMEREQELGDYQHHAAETLDQAPGGEPVWAMVTFKEPLSPEDAAKVVGDTQRVSAMIVDGLRVATLTEPIEGETRADVFNREIKRMNADPGALGQHADELPGEISSVIVRDTGNHLRELNGRAKARLTAVEVLPQGATWGAFGIRPVIPEDKLGTHWPL